MTNQNTRDRFGLFAGTAMGAGLTTYTTGMLTASLSAPIIIGGLVGLLPVYYTKYLHRKYAAILSESPILKATAHFIIAASSALLGTWIGLATTSVLFDAVINPFTLPALITAGISAVMILGLYLYVDFAERSTIRARTNTEEEIEFVVQTRNDERRADEGVRAAQPPPPRDTAVAISHYDTSSTVRTPLNPHNTVAEIWFQVPGSYAGQYVDALERKLLISFPNQWFMLNKKDAGYGIYSLIVPIAKKEKYFLILQEQREVNLINIADLYVERVVCKPK